MALQTHKPQRMVNTAEHPSSSAQYIAFSLKTKVKGSEWFSYVQNASTVSNVKVHNSAAPTVQLIDRVELNHSFRRALCSSLRCPILSLLQEISRLEEVLHLGLLRTLKTFGSIKMERQGTALKPFWKNQTEGLSPNMSQLINVSMRHACQRHSEFDAQCIRAKQPKSIQPHTETITNWHTLHLLNKPNAKKTKKTENQPKLRKNIKQTTLSAKPWSQLERSSASLQKHPWQPEPHSAPRIKHPWGSW